MSTITAGNVTVSCSLSADTTGNLVFQSGGNVTAMTIDTSQNVGIGATSPASYGTRKTLSVNGAGGVVFDMSYNGTRTGSIVTESADVNILNVTSGPLRFSTNATEQMRIDSSGNLIIGKTTTDISTIGWSLVKGIGSNCVFDMGGATNECFNYNNTGTGTYDIAFRYQGATKGYIRTTSTTVSFTNLSDYRLKENVQPMTGALAKVAALKPCTYTWKENGFAGQGFIAHELAEVVPDAVTGEKDAVNEDGSIKPQGIDTSFLVATLTAAIQEQQQMIEELKAEVAALKGVKA